VTTVANRSERLACRWFLSATPEVAAVGEDVVVETFGDLTIAIRFKAESHIDGGENYIADLLNRKFIAPYGGVGSGGAGHLHHHPGLHRRLSLQTDGGEGLCQETLTPVLSARVRVCSFG
jgi:hypothetical protein